METFLVLVALIVAIIAFIRATHANDRLQAINTRLLEERGKQDLRMAELEARVARLTKAGPSPDHTFAPPVVDPPATVNEPPSVVAAPAISTVPTSLPAAIPRPASVPPPLPQTRLHEPVPLPQAPPASPTMEAPVPEAKAKPVISLELFLGARLFAWLGGLAMFLGVIYGVRHAFQHNLIPPGVRAGMGFAVGLSFVLTGLRMHKHERYRVLAQAFAATGVLVLYGVTFAAHAVYHFPWFTEASTFLIMSAVTTGAFLMAVRMNAQVVAVLGMVGGFLTPPLCATGQDRPFALFSYIALLNIGLICVARFKRWYHLIPLAVFGTILMEAGWLVNFFRPEHYGEGSKTWIVAGVFCGFTWLMTAGARWCARRDPEDLKAGGAALAMAGIAMVAAMLMLMVDTVSVRPVLLYSWVLAVNAAVLYLAWINRRLGWSTGVIATLTFIHLSIWTTVHVTATTLIPALVIYLVFGLVHTGFSLLFVRKHGTGASVSWMPVITLLLILVPLVKLPTVAFAVWPAMLLTNLLVIGMALFSRRTLPVLAALLLTLASVLIFLHKLPCVVFSLWPFLSVLGLFAVVFVSAGLALVRRTDGKDPLAAWMPAISSVLPFALLVIATVHLPVGNPSAIFGFAAALAVFLLFLAWRHTQPTLVLASTICLLAVQNTWCAVHYKPDLLQLALAWFIGLGSLFVIYPMMTRSRWQAHSLPWISSAVALIGTFGLVYRAVVRSYPGFDMGLLPLGFAIIAGGVLYGLWRQNDATPQARQSRLAWMGGTVLYFVTLIFPLQFEHQWLTICWALEGAALCWLYLRVPHPGLRYVAAVLLTIAFVRLGMNPDVMRYHVRTGVPIWNWFLYSYGLVAAAQIAAGRLLAPPHHRLGVINLRGVFFCFAGLLLFILMNIEIADAYTPRSETYITIQFRGDIDLAREMTYTIAWGLFALALLVLGFRSRSRSTRYAGMALLGITLIKLFFHDLSDTDGIYRVGALMVVAVIAFAASWLYQRFAESDENQTS